MEEICLIEIKLKLLEIAQKNYPADTDLVEVAKRYWEFVKKWNG